MAWRAARSAAPASRLRWPLAQRMEAIAQLAGTVSRRAGSRVLTDSSGKRYTLSGEDLPARCEGLSVHVVGVLEDNFGLGVLHDEAVLRVQRWRAV